VASIVVYARYLPHDRLLVQVALGLQLGGALGNMIDRVRQGHVTDFLYFHNLPLLNRPWPAFNVADMAIVAGVILLAFFMLTYKEPQPAITPTEEQPGA
jgi:signal peptidase II